MGPSMAMKLVLFALFTTSSTLAIKNASVDANVETYKEGFPSLISAGERRLLQRVARPRRPRGVPRRPDAVVAQDGSGNFRTIKEALDASFRRRGVRRFVIHIKSGIYHEYLVIGENMKNIKLTGDGIGKTIITGSHSTGRGFATWNSATIVVSGDGFVARDITFQNTASPQLHQAPAITSDAPHSAFYRCSFDGYQDTIYARRGLQFYRECDIYGAIDFICGDAAVVIQNSNIYAKRSQTGNQVVIAVSERSGPTPTGIVIQNSRIMAAPDLLPVLNSQEIYLGRPWQPFARTVYIQNDINIPVNPRGWMPWDKTSPVQNVHYREFNNRGVGSSTNLRVRWPNVRVITNPVEARQFTVAQFIQGLSWLPRTGVPFIAGL